MREERSSDDGLASVELPVSGREIHHGPGSGVHAARSNRLSVRAIDTIDGIEALERTWRDLTPPEASPFQTFGWNVSWYHHFRDDYGSPLLLLVEMGDLPVAILPGYLKAGQLRLAGDCICDFQDLIAPSESLAAAGVSAILRWLLEEAPGMRGVFEKVSSEGWLHRFLVSEEAVVEGILTFSRRFAPCPCADLLGGLDPYLASLPRRKRQDFRRALRRLERDLPCTHVRIDRDYEIRVDSLEDAADFHVRHFRKEGASPLADRALREFLGEVAKDPDVGMQLGRLSWQGRLIAVDFGFARGSRYYGYLTGFDPEFAGFAPGKCLLLSRINDWVAKDGVEVLDFLAGDEKYKDGFTNGKAYEVRTCHVMSDSLGHRVRRVALMANHQGRRIARNAIDRAGLSR